MGKVLVKLAGGCTSFLKEVHLETELTGDHFDQLALSNADSYEQTICSILSDLMDESPYELTLSELYHVFLYVKVTSLGPKLTVDVPCQADVTDRSGGGNVVRKCGYKTRITFGLADGDIVYAPDDYKYPELDFALIKDESRAYQIRPPTVKDEIDLLSAFQEKGITRAMLADTANNKTAILEYTKQRIAMHFRDKETGDSFLTRDSRERAAKAFGHNSILLIRKATAAVQEVAKFGVENRGVDYTCKECGTPANFRANLLSGISL